MVDKWVKKVVHIIGSNNATKHNKKGQIQSMDNKQIQSTIDS